MKNGVQFTEINYGKGAAIIMKTKVFIDGSEGTTGLRINERFEKRDDIELLRISPELRKDPAERKRLIHESDITFYVCRMRRQENLSHWRKMKIR